MSDNHTRMHHDEFSRRSLDGVVSRRDLLRKAVLVGASASVLGLLSACGEDDAPEDVVDPGVEPDDADDDADVVPDDDDDDQPAEEARRGGRLRIATRGSVDSFDPQLRVVIEEAMANLHIYSGLVRGTVDLEAAPDLAESWDSNDAGDEWTFNLRSGVPFHNGREVEAQDVVETFNRLTDPELSSPWAVQLEMLDEVEARDETTVVFHLNYPYGGFPELIANDFARIIPIEEVDTLSSDPVGTGPYTLDRHIPGERTVLTRNEDFWDAENQGFVDEIHFIPMAEETTRIAALQGGDIDLIVDIAASSVPVIEGAENIEYEEIVTGTHLTVIMVYDEEPWTDARVRTALKLCLDRESVLQAAVQGFGAEAADQPIPVIDPMYPDLPIPERDIDRARELLAEAGYEDGIDLELHTSAGRAGMQEVALAVQEMAEPAGFRIEVRNHPIDQYWADIWMQRRFHMSNWNLRMPSDQMLQVCYVTGAEWNESHWSNEEFDELVRQAQRTPEPDERQQYLLEACTLLSEEGAVGIPIFRSGIDARNVRVHGYEAHPMRWLELHRVWIDE
jgi:peptide/nickel transport system substrate-binding protein